MMYIEWKAQNWQKVWESILEENDRETVYYYPKEAEFLIRIKVIEIHSSYKEKKEVFDTEGDDFLISCKKEYVFQIIWKEKRYEIKRYDYDYTDQYDTFYRTGWLIKEGGQVNYFSFKTFFNRSGVIEDCFLELISRYDEPLNSDIQLWEMKQGKKEKHRIYVKRKKKKSYKRIRG